MLYPTGRKFSLEFAILPIANSLYFNSTDSKIFKNLSMMACILKFESQNSLITMAIMGRIDKLNLVYILICFDFPDTNRPKPQSIITVIFDITHIKRLEVAHWQLCIYKSE